jgi:hypothetical protein
VSARESECAQKKKSYHRASLQYSSRICSIASVFFFLSVSRVIESAQRGRERVGERERGGQEEGRGGRGGE